MKRTGKPSLQVQKMLSNRETYYYIYTYVFARKMIALAGPSVGVLRLERGCRLCSAAPTFAVASTAEKTGLHVDMGPPAKTIDTIQTHIFLFVSSAIDSLCGSFIAASSSSNGERGPGTSPLSPPPLFLHRGKCSSSLVPC